MSMCLYAWREWDEERKEYDEKRCTKETWEDSDRFCIFHDPSPEKSVDLFREKLEEQMKSETEEHDFIGYCFPVGWDFSGMELKIDVSFNGATFQGAADFAGMEFEGNVDFREATFQDVDFREELSLNFSITTFKDFGYCLYYSIVTFTTLGYGDIHPLGYSHLIASVEALTGAFSMALIVVVFARKIMR